MNVWNEGVKVDFFNFRQTLGRKLTENRSGFSEDIYGEVKIGIRC